MRTNKLLGKIALVTGASRGNGKGIAIGLAEAGATVYVTGRTMNQGDSKNGLPGGLQQTEEEIRQQGGICIAVRCDHTNDSEVKKVFEQIEQDQNRLDILVNNVWGGYETLFNEKGEYVWEYPFWEQLSSQWDSMFAAGVRAHWIASRLAAKIMVTQQSGLIVNISHWAGQKYSGNVCYGVSKAATDRLTADTSHDLQPYQVAVVSLYPGLVRTERVMRAAEYLDLSNSESPQFLGRVVAALTSDPTIMEKSGKVLVAAQLAMDYGITDIDGKQPRPLTLDQA
ncbi:SDR family NAD(P)-dependent oxidoreductase [Leptothoe sp. LEGE 181152]|nr:SDR family NAD(P)-dependent oxidoreductase [Leptothoe sp. LEGE 181152]